MAKTKYLTDKELLEALHEAKLKHCAYTDHRDIHPTHYVDDLSEAADVDETAVVRLMTFDHVPRFDHITRKNHFTGLNHPTMSFRPFKHFRKIDDQWFEVLRSHWSGTIENGSFNNSSQITPKLARMFMLMTENIGRKGNFRGYSYLEEMIADALVNLCHRGMTFNEASGSSPFAYFTTIITNSFKKRLTTEKAIQVGRDKIISDAGMTASYSYTLPF